MTFVDHEDGPDDALRLPEVKLLNTVWAGVFRGGCCVAWKMGTVGVRIVMVEVFSAVSKPQCGHLSSKVRAEARAFAC